MRTSILSAAFVTALAVTAASPDRASAQVVVYPSITPVSYSYYTPGYSYGYNYVTPYGNATSYGWSNPYNYGNYAWYNARPSYYTGYPGYGYSGYGVPHYGYGYGRGMGYGRGWRW